MAIASRDIRRQALQKIAVLAATSATTTADFDNSDLDRLSKGCVSHVKRKENGVAHDSAASLSGTPMNIREFEVLLALCKAAPLLRTPESSQKLVKQLSSYILEAHSQVFVPSPFFRDIEPSPVEALSYNLTTALLSLGVMHGELRESIARNLWNYLGNCTQTIKFAAKAQNQETAAQLDIEDAMRIATVTISIHGFLDAAASYANFWSAEERLELIQRIHALLSEDFLIAVETVFSTIRNSTQQHANVKEWRRFIRHYEAIGRPLGAMLLQRGFMWLLVAGSSLLVADIDVIRGQDILKLLMSEKGIAGLTSSRNEDVGLDVIEALADIAANEMTLLENSADYIRLGSASQQTVAFAAKAGALTCYLNCALLNEDAADADILMGWLERTLVDPVQMADDTVANVVLRGMALISTLSVNYASNVSRLLPQFIVRGGCRGPTISTASAYLVFVLKKLSQDSIITTLYALGNVLSSAPNTERSFLSGRNGDSSVDVSLGSTLHAGGRQSDDSFLSLNSNNDEEMARVHTNVVQAICGIASAYKDPKITALAQSMLLQKIEKVSEAVDAHIVTEAAGLSLSGEALDFRGLLKLYSKLAHDSVLQNDEVLLAAIMKGRCHLSSTLRKGSPLYAIYLEHLLESIVNMGEARHSHSARATDMEVAAREIGQLLHPLATLMSNNDFASDESLSEETTSLIRDAWFNIVIHGFTTITDRGQKYLNELRHMAIHSKPLVTEQRGEQVESDIELNTVLRRGMSSDHETIQKKRLSSLLPTKASEIGGLSYRKVIFLQAAYLMESLRADAGDCTKALVYFFEPSMRRGDMSSAMEGVTIAVIDAYLSKSLSGVSPGFSAPYVAKQLVSILCGCCYRIERVQQAAMICADRIIREVPSALCQESSLFALLELLSLMWTSCLESETDEYEWKSSFTSSRAKVTVHLSDDYALRRRTLSNLHKKAREWVTSVMSIAPLNVKGLLQTYLSVYEDEGAYGHISLGRSFASEMGAVIPSTDQRLAAVERLGALNINTASDFMAQYTTRQEYRYAEALPERDADWLRLINLSGTQWLGFSASKAEQECRDAITVLIHLEARIASHKYVSISEVRDILRRVAALLYRSKENECGIVHYLVSIPFSIFTNQSIKLGISLWLGVIGENPRMESRILIEVAQQWESTVNRRIGVFDSKYLHVDPFYVKAEFAPSDRTALTKRQQAAHNILSPHMRLLQFLGSHYNATRLGCPHTEKAFVRLLGTTLEGLKHATNHPLAREIRFQIVLFGLQVLKYGTSVGPEARYVMKDQILSAALSWFSFAPQWSFGGNRLQLKAEIGVLADVLVALQSVAKIGQKQTLFSSPLQAKESLLQTLIESEQVRLNVWLYPLSDAPHRSHGPRPPSEITLLGHVKTAWAENPSIAIQLIARFPSAKLHKEVRWLLLSSPEKAISEPEALVVLLKGTLPDDVSSQLKYLLYWAPVNPISAVTYFLPTYRSHPFILQYAMRALESHSVDVTFFYVPQIVQTLRYDALGYVERYIVETAMSSQLFAHQIIWNMKANSYKDDNCQIPDPVKPTLDKVMARMVAGFSRRDRDFYEREFAFFDEVTDISGKLKPFIKRSKPEKKQKIEEELRKIKLDVGVYLPSNPDGVVIGIDRQSGKPLQSHAKAPYMATFRIKKNKAELEASDEMLKEANTRRASVAQDNSVEIWQSAIFKVGDDCRQDLLALQMISVFRSIFNTVGLDVYVFPYRVTATAPGCGVIDVLPNSISRDMVGREAVNGLYDYFISKYGNEDSLRFQEARSNFVKSMAAYSVISYLLQFKDRHNGNIMVDDAGHILHIDFGFCFDIVPGGVKFERAPFKLTNEMLSVMGGSMDHQAFKWFEELCSKAFLASRQYSEKLIQLVLLMLDSGLPCFKPETIERFRDRFVLDRSEREASDFMKGLIKKSHSNYSTEVYDKFQEITNGIPYNR